MPVPLRSLFHRLVVGLPFWAALVVWAATFAADTLWTGLAFPAACPDLAARVGLAARKLPVDGPAIPTASRFDALEAAEAAGPRYVPHGHVESLPVWVLSLPSAIDRRAKVQPAAPGTPVTPAITPVPPQIAAEFAAQAPPSRGFEFVDAVDGAAALAKHSPAAALKAALWRPVPLRFGAWEPLTGGQAGCLLSHARAWHRLASSTHAEAIILEDDFGFKTPDVRRAVTSLMASLPKSWDILFLNTCESVWGWRPGERGAWAGNGSRHIRHLTCTIGYVLRRRFALAALRELDSVTDMPVDMELRMMARAGYARAFVADPPLMWWRGDTTSTIAATDGVDPAVYGRNR